eukprot:COSAG02_NODE_16_length_56207_cov_9.816122_7_plen_285_part_00
MPLTCAMLLPVVGLIMGTRLWYAMFDADADDDAAFERRIDAVVREIGDRGKVMTTVSEAVPPKAPRQAAATAPTPAAPAPAPALTSSTMAPAPTPQPAAVVPAPAAPRATMVPATPRVAAPAQTFTPSMTHMLSSETAHTSSGGMGGSLAELTLFMREQQKMQMEREEKLREERNLLETKVEQQRQEIEQLRGRVVALPQLAVDVIDEDQISVLQSRLQSLHEAKHLTDDELFSLEDTIVDCIEVLPTTGASASEVDKVRKMLLVSSKVASDSTLARQLRRKFV